MVPTPSQETGGEIDKPGSRELFKMPNEVGVWKSVVLDFAHQASNQDELTFTVMDDFRDLDKVSRRRRQGLSGCCGAELMRSNSLTQRSAAFGCLIGMSIPWRGRTCTAETSNSAMIELRSTIIVYDLLGRLLP